MAVHEEKVLIPVDSGFVWGTFVLPGTLIPGVLFVHGWGGSQAQYLARSHEIAMLGCICLSFDLRGHADTQPQFKTVSRAMNLEDVVTAYDQLVARRDVDPSAIAVVGSSYGAYLAAILTSLRPVRWLSLRAPALYRDANWNDAKSLLQETQSLKAYRSSPVDVNDNQALRACRDYRGDVLLVESEHDDIVPAAVLSSYQRACKDAKSLTYRRLDGADHGLTQEAAQAAYSALLVQWLGEMIGGARRRNTGPVPTPATGSAETPPEHSAARSP